MGVCISSSVKISSCILLPKELKGNLNGKDFQLLKFWRHFSKWKKYRLLISLKERFWPTKIGLQTYGSTFLMDYLNPTEDMRPLFNISVANVQGVPCWGSWLVCSTTPLTLPIHCVGKDFQEIAESLNAGPDPNSHRLVLTFRHLRPLLDRLLNVCSVIQLQKKWCLFCSVYNTLSSVYKSCTVSHAST